LFKKVGFRDEAESGWDQSTDGEDVFA